MPSRHADAVGRGKRKGADVHAWNASNPSPESQGNAPVIPAQAEAEQNR
jgi:hypothetical protein